MLLAPGVVDAGLASLAGFLTTIYAARFLEPAELGVYALYFSGFLLAGLVPAQLYFAPVELQSLQYPLKERKATLYPTTVTGLRFCAPAALIAPLPGLIALGEVSTSAIVALAASNALLVFASPVQDHVRLMHHFCEEPLGAVTMSGVQFTVVVLAMAGLHFAGAPAVWIPFGSLAIANICSTTVGLLTLRAPAGTLSPRQPPLTSVMRLGGVLLAAEVMLALAALASEAVILVLVSAEALGFAAAASAVGRPVVVFSIGIGRVLAPRMMEIGMSRQRGSAYHFAGLYVGSLVAFVSVYLVAFGWPHQFNLMQRLVPAAYEVSGLVLALSIGLTIHRCATMPQWLLLGARKSKAILVIAAGSAAARLAGVVLFAPLIGAGASAAGYGIEGSIRGVWGWRAASALFTEKEP
jgi:O-antigen/teichoic acid export membrane protein